MDEVKISTVVNKPLSALVEEVGKKHFVLESKLKEFIHEKSRDHTVVIVSGYYHRSFNEFAYDVYLIK